MKTIFLILLIIVSCDAFSQISFEITVSNNRNYDLDISFSKGQLFETVQQNGQNLVLFKDTIITLKGLETKTIKLQGYCANEHRNSPSGNVKVAPLQLDAPGSAFANQESVWNFLKDDRTRSN
jgi:hypothetical protein